MASLGQVKEERQSIGSEGGESVQDVSRRMLMSPRSTCEALWRTQESVAMLRQIRGADSLHPDLNEEMFRAVRSVLLCLTELTDSGLKPSDARNDGSQLRLLQQECLSTEVLKLSELMAAVRSEILPRISREHPEAERCRQVSSGLSGHGPAELHPPLLPAQPAAGPSVPTSGQKHT
ncbi:hypothetical protein fugu_017682 [Takifugu bimaculatus]|uniref:Uncharacterized protein n=1 Tax=Takifugu bimaculatus TaxID=433685 RepID=A0A4Z2BRR3_9TELE|nr:hypothetical protein fugu_017682 [Takifugu bimaculatus]